MPQIWFRGEGVGVKPSRPGGSLHDLGDGVYFSDTHKVAVIYAKRRAHTPEMRRVYMIMVERALLGRVLDLTTDSRWARFINEDIGNGKSRLFYVRRQNELYQGYFVEFLKRHGLDRSKFDAIIGHEYVLDGKQLCIAHKNDRPSSLAVKLRTYFRPVDLYNARVKAGKTVVPLGAIGAAASTPVRSSTVASKTLKVISAGRAKGGGSGALATLGGGFGMMLIDFALIIIWPELWEKYAIDPGIQEGLKKIAPKVEAEVAKQVLDVARLKHNRDRAYARVTFQIRWQETESATSAGGSRFEGGVFPIFGETVFVAVGSRPVEATKDVTPRSFKKDFIENAIGTRNTFQIVTSSAELSLDDGYLQSYSAVVHELEWYSEQLGSSWGMDETSVQALISDRDSVVTFLAGYFGFAKESVYEHFRDWLI